MAPVSNPSTALLEEGGEQQSLWVAWGMQHSSRNNNEGLASKSKTKGKNALLIAYTHTSKNT